MTWLPYLHALDLDRTDIEIMRRDLLDRFEWDARQLFARKRDEEILQ